MRQATTGVLVIVIAMLLVCVAMMAIWFYCYRRQKSKIELAGTAEESGVALGELGEGVDQQIKNAHAVGNAGCIEEGAVEVDAAADADLVATVNKTQLGDAQFHGRSDGDDVLLEAGADADLIAAVNETQLGDLASPDRDDSEDFI